jgi:hypothetical protein
MPKYQRFTKQTLLTLLACVLAAPVLTREKPKLFLQITADQFCGDLPTRYYERLGVIPPESKGLHK